MDNYQPPAAPFAGARRQIDNRRAAYDLFNRESLFRNYKVLMVLLATIIGKLREVAYSSNRRHKQMPQWLARGIHLLPKMFAVTDDLQWKVKPLAFENEWRRTSREEIKKATGGDFSKWEITQLLGHLVEFGILKREHERRDGKEITAILLYFDAIRLTELLLQAQEFALKHQIIKCRVPQRVEIPVDRDDEETHETGDVDDGGGMLHEQPVICTYISTLEPAAVEASAAAVPVQEENNIIPPGEAGKNFPSSFSFSGGTARVLPDTAKAIALLRDLFPGSTFSAGRIQEIENLVHARLPNNRMTLDRLQRYAAARQSYNPDQWQFSVQELPFFLSRWLPILKHLREQEAVLLAEESRDGLTQSSDSLMAEVQEQAGSLYNEASALSLDPFQHAIDCPHPVFGPLGVISRLALIHDCRGDILPALARLSGDLKEMLFDHPRCYLLLQDRLPLRDWARLTDQEHCRLLQAARNSYREAYRNVTAYEMHRQPKSTSRGATGSKATAKI